MTYFASLPRQMTRDFGLQQNSLLCQNECIPYLLSWRCFPGTAVTACGRCRPSRLSNSSITLGTANNLCTRSCAPSRLDGRMWICAENLVTERFAACKNWLCCKSFRLARLTERVSEWLKCKLRPNSAHSQVNHIWALSVLKYSDIIETVIAGYWGGNRGTSQAYIYPRRSLG